MSSLKIVHSLGMARKRRTPEEARRLILEATKKLVVERGPDAIGLKDVADAAGVSHALVTHYFGTRNALMAKAMVDASHHQREVFFDTLRVNELTDPGTLIRLYLKNVTHPVTSRLASWAVLTGRLNADDFFTFGNTNRAIDLLEAAFKAEGTPLAREDLLFGAVLVISASWGYGLGRRPVLRSLGMEPSQERDEWFIQRLTDLLTGQLLGPGDGERAEAAPSRRAQDVFGAMSRRDEALPVLISLLDDETAIAEQAHQALRTLTAHDYGPDPGDWAEFASWARKRSREAWLLEALDAELESLREVAVRELERLGLPSGMLDPSAERSERRRARRFARKWLKDSRR